MKPHFMRYLVQGGGDADDDDFVVRKIRMI